MAALMATMGGLGKVLSLSGTILGGVGTVAGGAAANASAQYEAKQLEARATAERAAGQRDAMRERKQKELVISRAKAVGAASGGGVDLVGLGKIEEEGEYNALTAMWEGEERARGAEDQAAATRWSGKQAKRASFINAGATILDGGASFMEKYG